MNNLYKTPACFSSLAKLFTLLALLAAPLSLASSVSSADGSMVDPLFRDSQALQISLSGPFAKIKEEQDKDKEYPGTLEYVDASANEVSFEVKLSARGNSRLASSECEYAQLWLNFKKSQTPGTVFEGQDKLKLVVQCGRSIKSQQWLVQENLAFTVFEEFSDLHLKTRMLEVTYTDTDKPKWERSQLAFVIEHHKSLAKRKNMKLEKEDSVLISELDSRQTSAVSMFAYLIGNTDFSFIQGVEGDKCCHNMKILVDEQGRHFPVPYDFDNTGWVSAGYALGPSPNIGIKNTTERRYRGFCSHEEALYEQVLEVADKQQSVKALIDNRAELSRLNRRRLTKYTNEFFKTVTDPADIVSELAQHCRYPQQGGEVESSG